MRHRKNIVKLGRSSAHRAALLASLVCNLIEQHRIRTTVAKAKVARSLAEKMVTLGKRGTLAAQRQAVATLRRKERVSKLFKEIAPQFKDRPGGFTRIIRVARRCSDGSEMALLEWVNIAPVQRAKKAAPTTEKSDEKGAAPEPPKAE